MVLMLCSIGLLWPLQHLFGKSVATRLRDLITCGACRCCKSLMSLMCGRSRAALGFSRAFFLRLAAQVLAPGGRSHYGGIVIMREEFGARCVVRGQVVEKKDGIGKKSGNAYSQLFVFAGREVFSFFIQPETRAAYDACKQNDEVSCHCYLRKSAEAKSDAYELKLTEIERSGSAAVLAGAGEASSAPAAGKRAGVFGR